MIVIKKAGLTSAFIREILVEQGEELKIRFMKDAKKANAYRKVQGF